MRIKFLEYLEEKAELSKLGFFPEKKWEERELAIYHRKGSDRIDMFGISIYLYSQLKKENGIFIHHRDFVKGVSFPIINEIFEQAQIELIEPFWYDKENYNLDKILSNGHPNWKKPVNRYSKISENLLTSDKRINEKKAAEACKLLREIIEEQILPFYDLYPDLQSVNDEIINQFATAKKLSGFISGMIGFKKMVIMGLCNNPQYLGYIREYEEKLRKGVQQNKEKYLPYLEFFYRLKDALAIHKKEEKGPNNKA